MVQSTDQNRYLYASNFYQEIWTDSFLGTSKRKPDCSVLKHFLECYFCNTHIYTTTVCIRIENIL